MNLTGRSEAGHHDANWFGRMPYNHEPRDLLKIPCASWSCGSNTWFTSVDSKITFHHSSERFNASVDIGTLPTGYTADVPGCCNETPFAVMRWIPNAASNTYYIHVIYGDDVMSFTASNVDRTLGVGVQVSCGCDVTGYRISWRDGETDELHSYHQRFINGRQDLKTFLGADTYDVSATCCGDNFMLITQGSSGYKFDYEIKLKMNPEYENDSDNEPERVDDGSWLRLDDDTLCSANEVHSIEYEQYWPTRETITVWTVASWKFIDRNGEMRTFWNPFQYPVDLDEMKEFIPVKQVRRSTDVANRQWLLHRVDPTKPWVLIGEDNNIVNLTCERYDSERVANKNAQNGIYYVRINPDEDYVMQSQDPPQESIPPDCTDGEGGGIEIKHIIITKTTANEWMQNFLQNRYKGMQMPITGTASSQRTATSRVKDIEINFASRGTYYLEHHVQRERNPDFLEDGRFAIKDATTGERYAYEFEVDRGQGNIRNRLMLAGDKEAIPRYNKVPDVSDFRQGFRGGILGFRS